MQFLGWKILNDFHQVLATLCKGLIHRIGFQACQEKAGLLQVRERHRNLWEVSNGRAREPLRC